MGDSPLVHPEALAHDRLDARDYHRVSVVVSDKGYGVFFLEGILNVVLRHFRGCGG